MDSQLFIVLLWVLPALFCAVLAYRFAAQQHLEIVHPMIMMLTGGILFCLGSAGELYVDDLTSLVLWVKIEYIGLGLIPPSWLALAYSFDARAKSSDSVLNRYQYVFIYAPTAILIISVWTNELHLQFWQRVFAEERFGFQMLGTDRGPLPYAWQAYSYLVYFYALFIFVRIALRRQKIYRIQAFMLITAISVPFIFGLVNAVGFWPYLNIAAPLIGFTCLMLVFVILRFRLLEISPGLRRVIMMKMPDPLIAVNENGEVLDYNDHAQNLIFASPIHQSHTPLKEIIAEAWMSLIDLLDSDDESNQLSVDGKTWQARKLRLDPIEDVGFILSLQDISSQVASDLRLTSVEERLANLLDVLPVPVFQAEFSEDARVRMGNKAFSDLFLGPAQTHAPKLADLAMDDHNYQQLQNKLKAENTIQQEDLLVRTRDGQHIEAAVTAALRLEPESGETYIEGIIEDVGARNEVARELISARDLAEQASEIKTAFLANMSHEIRTPLNGIIPPAELLSRTELDPKQRESVEIIQSSGEVLNQLLNDLLDISKIEANRLVLQQEPLDLVKLVSGVIERHSAKAVVAKVDLSMQSHLVRQEKVLGDGLRINQIVENLISNAIKFSPEGAVTVNLYLDEQADKTFVGRIEVADKGIGIADDQLEAIFEPFIQADASTTRFYGGTGLGLTICKSLAALMGGDLTVASEMRKGSTFTLTFPTTLTEAQTPEKSDESTVLTDLTGKRVLVAEDDPMNQLIITEQLAQFNIAPIVVSNGQEALAVVAEQELDLILMDCHMPVMDGYEATENLRGRGVTIPIFALTANAGNLEDEKSRQSGMNKHLTKPISLRKLSQALADYLSD